MSWERHFTHVPRNQRLEATIKAVRDGNSDGNGSGGYGSKYSSYLPEVYAGQPNRIDRYSQYDSMDQDSEIHAALNIIADFCTQTEEQNPLPFDIEWFEEGSETEVETLKTAMNAWVRANNFQSSVWEMFRNTIKMGDQFFIRDPETYEWMWVDPANIQKITVDENKNPQTYIIKNLDINLQNKTASQPVTHSTSNAMTQGPGAASSMAPTGASGGAPSGQSPWTQQSAGFGQNQNQSEVEYEVDAEHVIHLSLSNGMDPSWPFGTSILEAVYKSFKQKELLEDSIIIYRVQRAPERRVFYIDVGNTPPTKAMAYVERVKNEIHQKRIPNRTGGGNSIMDAAYNPMTMIEDYFFAQTAEGRGSKVETLPGGENLGEIDDLKYFNNKLVRGLGVPTSYLPNGPEDGTHSWNDGRVGTAYIQEYRFGKYCERLQRMLVTQFDEEFKRYAEASGLEIEPSAFNLTFNPPQNFSAYRQIELDTAQISVFTNLADIPFFSKRFLLKRFLNLSEDEIIENERMWSEENAETVEGEIGFNPNDGEAIPGMSAVGVSAGSEFDGPLGDDINDMSGDEFGGDDFGGDDMGGPDMGGDDMGGPEPAGDEL